MRKKILLFGLVAALVAFSGCIDANQEPDPCDELGGYERDFCYTGEAVDNLDAQACYKVYDQEMKDDCYGAVAAAGGDYLCGNIENDFTRDTCHYMRAVTFVKTEYCDNMKGQEGKQECYDAVEAKKG